MKISIITVVYNGEKYLRDCIESVIGQTYQEIEYIIVDGKSTDGTCAIIQQYRSNIQHFISEPDKGLYDALNKGIALASGDIVGILNADDQLAGNHIIEAVAKTFKENKAVDGVYGDLDYIHPSEGTIIRKWRSKQANWRDIQKGWMPAHPTLYLKRTLFTQYGNYALDMGSVADYDLILRFFYHHQINAVYLPVLMVKMRVGGVSNDSVMARLKAFQNDFRALLRNKVPQSFLVLLKKKWLKLAQFER
ncbi:glycosyltransferase family 2 protein [Pedobacter rhizosphaerae]|uniref:Glycosyl transferase family 2 n=1 Tax=Pedobacter rhizosphaerae TaxID=390241 RepID=A0A1H9V1A1_9SPHI|nr:glycosyltransferase family 2 protein [Pedobacter rhizosphaerae]SES15164.1 Glycosyl transferase family 2 [Pedobacter rhizosphaerae]